MREFPSRIRAPRERSDRGLNVADYQAEFCIAYAGPAPAGKSGTVTLDAVIGRDGVPLTLSYRSGDSGLAEKAIEAVRHWAYRPLLLNGRPVEVATEIDVHFAA